VSGFTETFLNHLKPFISTANKGDGQIFTLMSFTMMSF